jgi:ribosomal protein S18 acetylase RimI-like enzyme
MDALPANGSILMEQVRPFTIEVLDESNPRRGDALRVLLAPPGTPALADDRQMSDLAGYVARHSLQIADVLSAWADQRLLSAAMLIESPGRLGAVYVPATRLSSLGRQATVALLQSLRTRAWHRSLCMLQALLEPRQAHLADVFAEAGFEFLAGLCYLERAAHDACPAYRGPPEVEFVPYTPQIEPLFLQVLGRTYRQSLDCPRLANVRRTEDVLATHRASGIFNPGNWFVARLAGAPVGILLLAGVHGRPLVELVYMGVVPEARGQGLGDALLSRAVDVCRREGDAALTLAVDSNNDPARDLYRRWSLREFDRRQAWFAPAPRPPSAPP